VAACEKYFTYGTRRSKSNNIIHTGVPKFRAQSHLLQILKFDTYKVTTQVLFGLFGLILREEWKYLKTNCFKVIGTYERDMDKKMEKTVYIKRCYLFYGDENLKDKSNNRFIYVSEVTIKIWSQIGQGPKMFTRVSIIRLLTLVPERFLNKATSSDLYLSK
jgi:hypothetical protein